MKQEDLQYPTKSTEWELRYGDGIVWMGQGLSFIILGFAIRVSALYFFILPALLLVTSILKKRFVSPRRGIARLKTPARRYGRLSTITVAILLIVILFVFYLIRRESSALLISLILGAGYLVMIVNWLIISYQEWDGKSQYPIWERIVIIALLAALVIRGISAALIGLMLAVYGLFALIWGLSCFIRFIRQNPVIEDEI